jgi:hypothetical protein
MPDWPELPVQAGLYTLLGSATAAKPPDNACSCMVNLAHEGRVDHLLVGSTGVSEPLPAPETRLGRRTALTFPLLPPPRKN